MRSPRHHSRAPRRLPAIAAAAALAAGAGLAPAAGAAASKEPERAGRGAAADQAGLQEVGLKVYTANVENLPTKRESCSGDWHELVHWIAGHSAPDLIMLQQVDGPKQAKRFTDRLNALHGAADFA